MKSGPRPTPTALRRSRGNPGKRGYNPREPALPATMPDCPPHLSERATEEWRRIALTLHAAGVVTLADRAALAAYCQSWGRWVEAEEKLAVTPLLLKTATGYVQQSPWLSIANKQLELMGRYMAELGLTPASRTRVAACAEASGKADQLDRGEMVLVWSGDDGAIGEKAIDGSGPAVPHDPTRAPVRRHVVDGDL